MPGAQRARHGVADRRPGRPVERVLARVGRPGLGQPQPDVRRARGHVDLRLRVRRGSGDLRAQLHAVDRGGVGVGDGIELDEVVVVAVDHDAALTVAAAERGGELGLEHVVVAGVVRGLQDEVPRAGRVAVGVDVAAHRGDGQRAVVDGVLRGVLADDRVPDRLVERRAVEVVAGAAGGTAAGAAVELEVVELGGHVRGRRVVQREEADLGVRRQVAAWPTCVQVVPSVDVVALDLGPVGFDLHVGVGRVAPRAGSPTRQPRRCGRCPRPR